MNPAQRFDNLMHQLALGCFLVAVLVFAITKDTLLGAMAVEEDGLGDSVWPYLSMRKDTNVKMKMRHDRRFESSEY